MGLMREEVTAKIVEGGMWAFLAGFVLLIAVTDASDTTLHRSDFLGPGPYR